MPPEAQEILLRITKTKEHIEYVCEFLEEGGCRDVVSMGSLSVMKSEILASFTEFVTSQLSHASNRAPHPIKVKIAASFLNQFIDDCVRDSGKDTSSSLCHTPVGTATPELKRQSSTSSSSSPPSKKLKILEPAKLLHLKVDHPEFWQYLIAFTSLFDPAHAPELVCPGCGNMYMVSNPHNFYTHVLHQHDVLCREARIGAVATPPEFPPSGDLCRAHLSRLPECALTHVPLPWLAAMPITSLPAAIQARIRTHNESLASRVPSAAAPVCTPGSLLPHSDTGDDGLGCPTPLSALYRTE